MQSSSPRHGVARQYNPGFSLDIASGLSSPSVPLSRDEWGQEVPEVSHAEVVELGLQFMEPNANIANREPSDHMHHLTQEINQLLSNPVVPSYGISLNAQSFLSSVSIMNYFL